MRSGRPGRTGAGSRHQHQGDDHGPEGEGVDAEDDGVIAGEQDQPGDGRADDPAEVELRRRERHRPEQVGFGHQVGDHGLVGGEPDRPRRPTQEREEHQHGGRVVVESDQYGQDDGEARFRQGGDDQPTATVQPVGQGASDRGEQTDGDEAGGGHQAGPARLLGAGEDEHPQGDRLHPRAQVGDEGGRPDEGEVPRAERAERSQGHRARLPASDSAAGSGAGSFFPSLPCVGAAVRTTRCWPWWPAPRRRRPAWRSCGSGRTCPDVTRTAPFSPSSSDLLPVLLPPPWVPLRDVPQHGGHAREHLPQLEDRTGAPTRHRARPHGRPRRRRTPRTARVPPSRPPGVRGLHT